MIPKRLFMMWLGGPAPAYAENSAAAFRHAYPDWDVRFIKRDAAALRSVRDGQGLLGEDAVLRRAMDVAFVDPGPYAEYVGRQRSLYGDKLRNVMLLSDVFRLMLLNEYGGVYVDADSLPGRPFDGGLLSGRFCVCRGPKSRPFADNYFMGQPEGDGPWTDPADTSASAWVRDTADRAGAAFQYRRAAFIKGMEVAPSTGFYVEHFAVRTWEAFGGLGVPDF